MLFKCWKVCILKVSRFWSPNLDHEFSLFNGIYNLSLQFHLTFFYGQRILEFVCVSYQTVDIFKNFLRFQPTWKDLEICRTIFSTKLRKLRIQVKDRIDCFFPRSCLHEFQKKMQFLELHKCGDLTVLRKAFRKTL